MSQSSKPINFIDETAEIGEGSTVWHYATILQEVKIGKNVSIGSHAEIGRGSVIGDDTRISAMVFLPPNSRIGKRCFVGPGCLMSDDRYPFAGNREYKAEPPILEDGCSLGLGVVLLPGVRIGKGAMIGAGSVIVRDVAPGTVVYGEAARVRHMMNFDIYAEPMRSELMESHLLPV